VVIADLASSGGADVAGRSRSVFVPADITDPGAMRSAVAAAARLGPLRVLVNCAGIGTPGRVIGRGGVLPLEQFERVVRVNLTGTFNATRLAAEAMAAGDLADGDPARSSL
jgi:NAD(P)-dependent dehydrogenase (short-subunit alcohol dehydrogenase family)